jgi:uncharacterized Fe-S cluster-containing radical SAM superfamily protein
MRKKSVQWFKSWKTGTQGHTHRNCTEVIFVTFLYGLNLYCGYYWMYWTKNAGHLSLSKSCGVHTKLRPPPPKKKVNCFKSGKWGTQRNTHIVHLLIKFIQIRTNNTKSLYLNCHWISASEPSITKEHFCEVSNLGDNTSYTCTN